MSDDFRSGLARLRKLGHGIMSTTLCAEGVWRRDHRRIIGDYLITTGETVFRGTNQVVTASLTREAVLSPEGSLSYPSPPFPEQNTCSKALSEFVCPNRRPRLHVSQRFFSI